MKLGCDRGNAAILFAGALFALVGVSAFALDLPHGYTVQGRLQNAADAGALAAAQMLYLSPGEVKAIGASITQRNVDGNDGEVTVSDDVALGRYDVAAKTFVEGATPHDAVRVRAKRTSASNNSVPTFLAGVLGHDSMNVAAEAIAMKGTPGNCIYALAQTGNETLKLAGTPSLTATDCGVQVNSDGQSAAATKGQAKIDAHSICVTGGASGSGFSPNPDTGCAPKADPLAHVPEPEQPPGACEDISINKSKTLEEGCYGNASFEGNADITLSDGLYYFKDADVEISSASLTGENVLIYLDANSSIHISGNGVHTLSAMETGPHAGIALFQSRDAVGAVNKKSGTSALNISGAIYMPSSTFDVSGTGGVQAKAGKVNPQNDEEDEDEMEFVHYIEYIITDKFHISGTASFTVGDPDLVQTGGRAVLVR